ncbi:AAA family ATPase [Nocardia sp. FBN12]|uniref:AAA family ATPase n=1 Tax=Nocardia sp. FBN12 TaxID=3419766 RepID=UPI003CFC7074
MSVDYFRGIEHSVLTFTDEIGIATSALLFGDNGSGKSSLLEAVAYGLSGREPRHIQIGRTVRIDPRSKLARDGDETRASVLLEDGRTATSGIKVPFPEFELVSILIKRDHLLAFGRSNDEQRGKLLHTIVDTRFLSNGELSQREKELLASKADSRQKFSEVNSELAQLLKIRPQEMPGLQPDEVQIFRTAKRITSKQVYRGRAKRYGDGIQRLTELGNQLQGYADDHERIVNELARAAVKRRRSAVIEVLTAASDRLNSAFHEIAHFSTRKIISRIELSQVPDSGHVALSAILLNGRAVPAYSVLSEANLDLVSLLAIVALIRDGANRGQSRVLLLDDVFQSVDDSLRDRVAEFMFSELSDWQLIMTFHDRAWYERFSDIAKEYNFPHVRRRVWTTADGSVCVSSGYNSSYVDLGKSLKEGDFNRVPTIATRLLEEMFESLSVSLKCKVNRNDSDKYTLGDLTPGIRERCAAYSSINSALEKLEKVQYMRNLVGAHSTSWAEGFTDAEARDFGVAVRDVYELVVCQVCNTSLRYRKGAVVCKCGSLHGV